MSGIKPWIIAARLRTLPLALSAILVGTAIAANDVTLNYLIAGLTLLTAFLLQILSNFANDYGDAVSGVDSDERKGPDRMVQSGVITKEAMRKAVVLFSVLTLISGSCLLIIAFPDNWGQAGVFLLLGFLAIIAAIKYTVGKNPYGYVGFGDLFVFIFFGLVAVFGTYYLQTKQLNWVVLLPASTLGLFSMGVLNVNNIRDIESDKASGKKSIPVRLGKRNAVIYHGIILELGMLLSILFVLLNFTSWWGLIFVFANALFISNIQAVSTKSASQLDPHLKQMAISTLVFSILFVVGQYLS